MVTWSKARRWCLAVGVDFKHISETGKQITHPNCWLGHSSGADQKRLDNYFIHIVHSSSTMHSPWPWWLIIIMLFICEILRTWSLVGHKIINPFIYAHRRLALADTIQRTLDLFTASTGGWSLRYRVRFAERANVGGSLCTARAHLWDLSVHPWISVRSTPSYVQD